MAQDKVQHRVFGRLGNGAKKPFIEEKNFRV